MHEKLQNFLDLLNPEQMDKFASALEEVETTLAQETGNNVETIKSAELLQSLTMEGFFDGLNDLAGEDLN